jgi:hypothetical protein
MLSLEVGALLYQWCKGENDPPLPQQLQQRFGSCQSIEELNLLLHQEDVDNEQIAAFTRCHYPQSLI